MSYVQLTKPRSVLLLLVTAMAGMVMATPEVPQLHVFAMTLLGGALAAGGANTLNSYLDRDLDALMSRTAGRPLPSGKVTPGRALALGLSMCVLSVAVFASGVNWLSALLALAGVVYYVVIYTIWLKRRSTWNVAIGGGAGALPILVGWSAATGQLSFWPLWLGAIVIIWTMPHFWALALIRRSEYALAGVPMLPVVKGGGRTREEIVYSSVALVLTTLLLAPTGFTGPAFLVTAIVSGALMIFLSIRLLHRASFEAARQVYRYSVVYLALLFTSMIADRVIWMMSQGGAA